jgi:hypothetical protein
MNGTAEVLFCRQTLLEVISKTFKITSDKVLSFTVLRWTPIRIPGSTRCISRPVPLSRAIFYDPGYNRRFYGRLFDGPNGMTLLFDFIVKNPPKMSISTILIFLLHHTGGKHATNSLHQAGNGKKQVGHE